MLGPDLPGDLHREGL